MDALYTADQIRAAEAQTGDLLTSGRLMQRAAAGLAAALVRELDERHAEVRCAKVLMAVGPGNNGADALYAATRLLPQGIRVWAWRAAEGVHGDAWASFLAAGGAEVDAVGALNLLPDAALVVDGVLGLGGRGGLDGAVRTFADACRDTATPVVAVDLPSGLVADSNQRWASFDAALTVTFGSRKLCHVVQPAASACGRVELVDIGLPLEGVPVPVSAWTAADVAAHYPYPDATSDKYSRGAVGVDTGSAHYPGAAVLSCSGAVYGGAGFVRYLGQARDAVIATLPNVVLAPGRVQSHLVGSGWGERDDAAAALERVLAEGVPTVVDADALHPDLLARLTLRPDVVLTPHAGELGRLLGVERPVIEADPLAHVRLAAQQTGATVLLKGASQLVATPRGDVTLAVGGPAWTAQAGSGDTLAGVVAAMLAAGRDAATSALLGASLQALTAARHPGPRPPHDLARWLPDTIAELDVSRHPRP